ncbi:hypothetical protein LDO26_06300 [Luteimonas sp. BDR2-5]|uniref:hypothetical protein n=1 Tax=Proluteimonas luteida TaxID=2878685 RepID=UPI001E490CDE|nr:hypothetical protein [Luteimonas sp. BDR2-5]MCD9027814.1 hypothetical protein [Luteimonas sp. BDR2-5]
MPSLRPLLLLPVLLLPLAACSKVDPVPERPERAVRLSACQAADGARCTEAFAAAPKDLELSAGDIRGADIATGDMQCPDGDVAVASCPSSGRLAICDLGNPAGILVRVHLYTEADATPETCDGPRMRLHRLVPAAAR